jgi:hypothetical protein
LKTGKLIICKRLTSHPGFGVKNANTQCKPSI